MFNSVSQLISLNIKLVSKARTEMLMLYVMYIITCITLQCLKLIYVLTMQHFCNKNKKMVKITLHFFSQKSPCSVVYEIINFVAVSL